MTTLADEPVTPAPEPQPAAEPAAAIPAEPQWDAKQNFEKLERMLYTIAGQLQQNQQAQVPDKKSGEYTDQELWSLAQQGNQEAFVLHQQRIADRQFDKRFGAVQQNQNVASQLQAIAAKYPELADNNHPLTQRALAFKQALVGMGHDPNSGQTTLDAVLRAVADSRDLIAPRPAAQPVRAHTASGHFAPSHQQAVPTPQGAEKISPDEASLAKKMGIKDPGKAKAKFSERNGAGLSRVSPSIAAALDLEERQGNVR